MKILVISIMFSMATFTGFVAHSASCDSWADDNFPDSLSVRRGSSHWYYAYKWHMNCTRQGNLYYWYVNSYVPSDLINEIKIEMASEANVPADWAGLFARYWDSDYNKWYNHNHWDEKEAYGNWYGRYYYSFREDGGIGGDSICVFNGDYAFYWQVLGHSKRFYVLGTNC